MQPTSIIRPFRSILQLVPARRRLQFLLIVLLMLAGAASELVTLGAFVPFVRMLSTAESAQANWVMNMLPIDVSGFGDSDRKLLLALIFAVALIVAGAIRVCVSWASIKFSMAIGNDLSNKVYRNLLQQSYSYHLATPSSEMLAVMQKIQIFSMGVLVPVLQGVTAVITSSFIVLGLVYLEPIAAGIAIATVGGVYAVIVGFTHKVQKDNSFFIASAQSEKLRLVQEGVGGIRDVIINGLQAFYASRFARIESGLRKRLALNFFLAQAPRYVVETVLLVAATFFVFQLSGSGERFNELIPLIAAFGLGVQRMLPHVQLAYRAGAQLRANTGSTQDIQKFVSLGDSSERVGQARIDFDRRVSIENVSFGFDTADQLVLSGVNLTIHKGQFIAITGRTGCGKSTLVDLIMGLHRPTSGVIRIDGVALSPDNCASWQGRIAHVPQHVFLVDGSIVENITLGQAPSGIDHDRLLKVIRLAELESVVETLPEGVETRVGERGSWLSGGQRQRIGIARALYLGREVLVLDEATSALDSNTHRRVLGNLRSLGPGTTLISITHRVEEEDIYDSVFELA